MDEEQKIPQGRFGRLARLAKAGARTGASLLRSKDATRDAQQTAAVLGQLRGVATKIGQMASYVDGVIPPEHREAYEQSMAKLQSATPRSSSADIRARVEEELGAPLEDLFTDWEEEPLASASIGQVHRARLHDGRRVAIKIQHPGIAEAMEDDLSNASLMRMAAGMTGFGKFDAGRLIDEARDKFREELDYSLEARRQTLFRAIHADDPEIKIPEIIASHSTQRVLTSDFFEGIGFDEAREAPEALRGQWAEVLWRFVYKGMLYGGLFNADPHPGNYRFFDDGTVGFLDFGCVQPIPEYRRIAAVTMHQAAQTEDWDLFREHAKVMLHLDGGRYEDMAIDYGKMCFRPITESPFRITRDFAGSLVDQMKGMTKELRAGKRDGYVPMPEGFLFINRLQFGFYSVLARLNAPADYKSVEAAYLPLALGGRFDPRKGADHGD